jgi:transposase
VTDPIIETIGCDLGDKQSELCILLPNGQIRRLDAVKTTRKAMTAFFARPRAHVVIEVGTHSRWMSELLKKLGHHVTVANPRRVKLISQSNLKRDKKDAEMLARLGRADEELLSPVEHRGSEAQAPSLPT